MYRHLFKYEWKKAKADRSMPLVLLMIIAFTLLAVNNGISWVHFQQQSIEKLQAADAEQMATILHDVEEYEAAHPDTLIADLNTPVHPLIMYASKRAYAWKAPSPMAVFCTGQSDIYPHYHLFTGVTDQMLLVEEEIRNPLNLMIGSLDLSFVLIYLLPVILIGLSFNIWSGEEEAETSRLIRTQQLGLRKYLWYKLLFRFGLVFSCFLLTAAISALILDADLFMQLPLVPLMILIGLSALYLFFWLSLAFLINAFGRSSEINALALMACWIFFLFMIPSFLELMVEKRYPLPSRNHQVLEKRNHVTEIDRETALQAYFSRHPELKRKIEEQKPAILQVAWYPGFMVSQDSVFRMDKAFEHQVQAGLLDQERLLQEMAYTSPALMLRLAMNSLSENSLLDFMQYQAAVDAYILEWRRYLGRFIFVGEKLRIQDFEQLPRFESRLVQVSERTAAVPYYQYMLILGICCLVFLAGGVMRLPKA